MVKELICSIALVGAIGVSNATTTYPIQDFDFYNSYVTNFENQYIGDANIRMDNGYSFSFNISGSYLYSYYTGSVDSRVASYAVGYGVNAHLYYELSSYHHRQNDSYLFDVLVYGAYDSTGYMSESIFKYFGLRLSNLDFDNQSNYYVVFSGVCFDTQDLEYYSSFVSTGFLLTPVRSYDNANFYILSNDNGFNQFLDYQNMEFYFTLTLLERDDLLTDEEIEAIQEESYNQGYNTGFDNGVNSSSHAVKLFTLIADVPIYYLKSLFNFSFFGIPMYTLVLGVITLLVLLFVIKKVI